MRRVRPEVRELAQAGNHPEERSWRQVVNDGTLAGDDIDAGDEDGVGVVIRKRIGVRRWLGIRHRGIISVIMMMVMPAGTVMMVTVFVRLGGSRIRVDVRTKVVSGGLIAVVCVAEAG